MLALMDAGVPVKDEGAGISVSLGTEYDKDKLERYELLTDIIGSEDHFVDMDFKLCGTAKGVTGYQLDLKLPGINLKVLREAIQHAREAHNKILGIMGSTVDTRRGELSNYVSPIETIKINPRKV